jgi:hypothetical protein
MKKTLRVLFLITIFISTFSCVSQTNESGLEIYIQNIPHPILTNENPEECYCCIELQKGNLSKKPIITKNDIEHFDWQKQNITLTNSGMKKLIALDFAKTGVYGFPTAIVLNGKPIYSLMLFPIGSSVGCDRPFTYLSKENKNLYIHFGIGKGKNELRFGDDPRFNAKLEEYIEKRYGNN